MWCAQLSIITDYNFIGVFFLLKIMTIFTLITHPPGLIWGKSISAHYSIKEKVSFVVLKPIIKRHALHY